MVIELQFHKGIFKFSRTPDRSWGIAHQSSLPKQTRFVKKLLNGSKVLRKGLTTRHVRKFTKISFFHRLLVYWLTKHMPKAFLRNFGTIWKFF